MNSSSTRYQAMISEAEGLKRQRSAVISPRSATNHRLEAPISMYSLDRFNDSISLPNSDQILPQSPIAIYGGYVERESGRLALTPDVLTNTVEGCHLPSSAVVQTGRSGRPPKTPSHIRLHPRAPSHSIREIKDRHSLSFST